MRQRKNRKYLTISLMAQGSIAQEEEARSWHPDRLPGAEKALKE